MKKQDIAEGGLYAVETDYREHGTGSHGYGSTGPKVKATVLAAGIERDRSSRKDGARCRLEEPFRIVGGDAGFRELPVGHEFVVTTTNVLGPWGEWRDGRAADDEQRTAERASRYHEQDELRRLLDYYDVGESAESWNATDGVLFRGDVVHVPRTMLLRLLQDVEKDRVECAEADDARRSEG